MTAMSSGKGVTVIAEFSLPGDGLGRGEVAKTSYTAAICS